MKILDSDLRPVTTLGDQFPDSRGRDVEEEGTMPVGTCKLCLQFRQLRKSHLISRAMYKHVRMGNRGGDPIVVGRKVTAVTSRQVKDYLLCGDCEQLLNSNGEKWAAGNVWNGSDFQLRNRLNLAMPLFPLQDSLAYSGTRVGVDMDKLGYFGASLFWRAGVHVWNVGFGEWSTKLDLGEWEEPLRLFLLGSAPFPANAVLIATVCSDDESAGCFMTPGKRHGRIVGFGVTVLGIRYMLLTVIDSVFRELCCMQSGRRLLFARDCAKNTIDAFATLIPGSRVVGVLGAAGQ